MGLTALTQNQIRRFPSPLRYPGGKGKVANFIKLLLLENDLLGAEYVEPYAGGASVALNLLFEGFVDHVHINDLDPSIYAFWKVVLDRPDEICQLVRSSPITIDEWQKQRDIQADPDAGELAVAFSTFYMNRTNRSGIITGGMIGGRKQVGPYGLDARFNRENLVRRIEKISRYASRVSLSGEDALNFLKTWCDDEAPYSLVYLDPPYFNKGGDLYRNAYGPDDHAAVANLTSRLKVPWIVSYDTHPSILGLYKEHHNIRYSLSYSAGTRTSGSEVMFLSDGLFAPDVESPAGIPVADVDARLASATY